MSDDSLTSITFMTCQTTGLQSKFKNFLQEFLWSQYISTQHEVEVEVNPKNKPKSLLAISACAFPGHMSGASIVIVI